jgi:hypothetical protein
MLTLIPPLRCIVALARERILVRQGRWFASPHPPMIGEATTSACGHETDMPTCPTDACFRGQS